jgi:SAM-dependent methyltransferase
MSDDRFAALEARLAELERQNQALRGYIVPALFDVLDRHYARLGPAGEPRCLACDASGPDAMFPKRVDQCVFGGGRLERLECPSCGCVFGPMKYLETPGPVVDADYRLLYTTYTEGDSTEAELRAFHALQPRRDGLYLNWGSGAWSASVERLRAEGYDVWGYEPHAQIDSPYVVKSRGEVSARFDGVFSNNVIEHLFDPAAQFRDFATILKPGGRMAHASPCYAYEFAFTRFHVFFPLGDSPARLAERTGFRLVGAEDDGTYRVRVFEADA